MTTTTPVPCPRCGAPDRSRYHSCRLTRSLAQFRADLLDTILTAECGWADECYADMAAEARVERYFEDAGWEEAERDRVEEDRRGVIGFADAWDLADPSRTAACPRHGERMVHGRCWECDAERQIARRDADEYDHIPV